MAEVKALFPIGKTQWAKWNDAQRTAFNEAREAGVPYNDAVEASNRMKKGGILGALDSVVREVKKVESTVNTVVDVAATVSPVIAVAKTVVKATKKKGK